MPSFIQRLKQLGAGVFITNRGVDSRLGDADFWRAFEEPVIVWIHGGNIDIDRMSKVLRLTQKLPNIKRFRFTGGAIDPGVINQIRKKWPDLRMEFAPLKGGSQSPGFNFSPATSKPLPARRQRSSRA